jgi:GAF domain-containing protein
MIAFRVNALPPLAAGCAVNFSEEVFRLLRNLQNHLQNPAIAVAAAAAFALLLLLVLLLIRSRKRKEFQRAATLARQREAQFAEAARQIQLSGNAREIALQINAIFSQHLSIPLAALYAGRGDTLINILPSGEQPSHLKDFLPSAVLEQYQHPQIVSAAPFIARSEQQLTEVEVGNERNIPMSETDQVAVFPWRGAFGWKGFIIGRLQQKLDESMLQSYEEAIGQLGVKLSLALEFESKRSMLELAQERARRSLEFARSMACSLNDPSSFETIARAVAELLGTNSAALWRIEPASGVVQMIASYGLRSSEFLPIPIGQGITGRVAESGQIISLEDAPSDPRCLFPRECRESGIVAYLGAPAVAAGQIVGVVEVYSPQPHRWSEDDQATLSSAAAAIAEAMKRAAARTSLKVESAYFGLSEAMQQLSSRDEVMEAAVEVLGHALDVSRAMIVEFDERGSASIRHEHVAQGIEWAVGADLAPGFAETWVGGKPITINDSRKRSLLSEEARERLQVLSEMAVPIKLDSAIRAFIYLHQVDRTRDWQADEIQFAERVARQVSLSIAKLEAIEAARRAAEENLLARQIAYSLPEAVICLDREGRLIFFNQVARQWLHLKDEDLGRIAEMTEPLVALGESFWEKVSSARATSRFEIEQAQPTDAARVAVVAPIYNDQGEITGRVLMLSQIHAFDEEARIGQYERKLEELERQLSHMQLVATQASTIAERAQASEAELRKQLDQLRQDEARARASVKQLLEINRLKSEFILDTGLELESSLQSVLSLAESLERGSYGQLTPQQLEAVKQLTAWAQQVKAKTDALIEYSRTRSRRPESKSEK